MGFPRGQTRTATGGAVGGGGSGRGGRAGAAADFTPVPKDRRAKTLRKIAAFFSPYKFQVVVVLAAILSTSLIGLITRSCSAS